MRIIDVNTKSSTSSFSIWACVVAFFAHMRYVLSDSDDGSST